ncbi:MarR family transcriptional regulator [Flavobacterium sp. WV_118_3]|uniref:MarR family winged helix-turn-helix transcriptional regulator n=1 Tax=Flavobacterium sp. WV_118_3 TaxID=3151764 RepID=UPI00321B3D04
MNIIDESGILAISTRLQRLSEQLRKDGAQVYKAYGIAFEPKWFPVIYTLYHKEKLSVVEIANEIGYTHPSTISLLKELEKQKLIRSVKDKEDERKRRILLTSKGLELIEQMKPVWDVIRIALNEIADNQNALLAAITEAENKIATQSFLQRVLQLKQEQESKTIEK